MSRTNPTGGSSSPIKKYISFSGGDGLVSYWDKNRGEKGERVEFDSLSFTVLDVRNSITGYHEESGGNYTSNMVVDINNEPLKVVRRADGKTKDIAEGLYKDIKDQLKAVNAKFTANIIALADIEGEKQIVNIQLTGIALTNWIEFTNEHSNNKYYDYEITIKQGILSKREKGSTVAVTKEEEKELDAKLKKNPRAPKPVWFYTAIFEYEDLTDEEIKEATDADAKVQDYFNSVQKTGAIQSAPAEKTNVTGAPEPSSDDDEDDDLPF